MYKKLLSLSMAVIVILLSFSGCKGVLKPGAPDYTTNQQNASQGEIWSHYEGLTTAPSENNISHPYKEDTEETKLTMPEFSGTPYCVINNNVPLFEKGEITDESFENYAPLDELGRCGVTIACIGKDIMPTEKRGEIGQVKPSGWHTAKYDCVDGKYLYNRCHLIGYQLTGENANRSNLITGTRYMNVDGMLPFENMVDDYVEETNNHVMYRVTPVFEGNNLVASGVIMEAFSVEDNGEGICFNVYCYNVQPGVTIDYKTGESYLSDVEFTSPETNKNENNAKENYILNINSKKFHKSSCASAQDMNPKNKKEYTGFREDLISEGYSPCGYCKP